MASAALKGASSLSKLTPWIRGSVRFSPDSAKWQVALSNFHLNRSGYRQMGLMWDDLIPEESDVVQLAIKRLSPQLAYDRVFRLRRAFQLSLTHTILPAHEQIKDQQDKPYLRPLIEEIEFEIKERETLDSAVVNLKHRKK